MTAPFTPDPARFEPVEFPPPWPTRPWIYGNVITSRNGIVTWIRAGAHDDPIRAIAGGDFSRPGRRADVRLMRRLRAGADAVSFGAQTLRDQPNLIGAVDDIGGEVGEALIRFRVEHGRRRVPLQVVYSESGRLDLAVPLFTTPGLTTIVVTTDAGRVVFACREVMTGASGSSSPARNGSSRAASCTRTIASSRQLGVRYLDCEGGAVILEALHRAGLLDEIFVTVTDIHIDPAEHAGVKRITPLDAGTARLIAEGHTAADPGYRFQRWRFKDR